MHTWSTKTLYINYNHTYVHAHTHDIGITTLNKSWLQGQSVQVLATSSLGHLIIIMQGRPSWKDAIDRMKPNYIFKASCNRFQLYWFMIRQPHTHEYYSNTNFGIPDKMKWLTQHPRNPNTIIIVTLIIYTHACTSWVPTYRKLTDWQSILYSLSTQRPIDTPCMHSLPYNCQLENNAESGPGEDDTITSPVANYFCGY